MLLVCTAIVLFLALWLTTANVTLIAVKLVSRQGKIDQLTWVFVAAFWSLFWFLCQL